MVEGNRAKPQRAPLSPLAASLRVFFAFLGLIVALVLTWLSPARMRGPYGPSLPNESTGPPSTEHLRQVWMVLCPLLILSILCLLHLTVRRTYRPRRCEAVSGQGTKRSRRERQGQKVARAAVMVQWATLIASFFYIFPSLIIKALYAFI